MLRSTPKFVNILLLSAFVAVGCSGKKMPEEKKEKQSPEVQVQAQEEEVADTIWLKDVVHTMDYDIDFSWDKDVVLDGAKHTLFMKSERLEDSYEGVYAYWDDEKIKAQRKIGPNVLYTISLYDSLDNLVSQNSWDKYDLERWIATDLLAGSRGDRWYFVEYNEAFERFFVHVYWMLDDSDVGEIYPLFLNRKLEVTEYFCDSFTGGGGCDCNAESSEDKHTYAFCSRIFRSNGKHTPFDADAQITGSFILNNDYVLVIENFDGKPPYNNAKILDRRGAVVKSFDYTGISGALGYTIPKFKVDDQEALFLLDDPIRSLFRIDLNNPLDVQTIDIDDMERMKEGEVLERDDPNRIDISSETKGFVFEYRDGVFRYYSETQDY